LTFQFDASQPVVARRLLTSERDLHVVVVVVVVDGVGVGARVGMFERTLARVLDRVLGRYIRGFAPETISLGVLARSFQLNNIECIPDALNRDFALPFDIVRVSIAHIDVSYGVLVTDPLRVRVRGVKIVIKVPDDDEDRRAATPSRARRDANARALEALRRAMDAASSMDDFVEELVSTTSAKTLVSGTFAAVFARVRASVEDVSVDVVDVASLAFDEISMHSTGSHSSRSSSGSGTSTSTANASQGDDADDADDARDAEATRKRVDVRGFTIKVRDGQLPFARDADDAHVVVGPHACVRVDVTMKRRHKSVLAAVPQASPFVVKVDIRDAARATITPGQITALTSFGDDIERWTKRRAHGERRPAHGDGPVAWWRFATRASTPRGEKYHRRALMDLKHRRTVLESYIDHRVDVLSQSSYSHSHDDAPAHVREFMASLTPSDVRVLDDVAAREIAAREEREYAFDGALPSYKPAHAAVEMFTSALDDAFAREDKEERDHRRDVEALSRAATTKLKSRDADVGLARRAYEASSRIVSGAFSYAKHRLSASLYDAARGVQRDEIGDTDAEITIRAPDVYVTTRADGARCTTRFNRITVIANAVRTPSRDDDNDDADDNDDVSTARTVVRVREISATDESSISAREPMMWSRDGSRDALIVRIGSDDAHVDVASIGVAIAPHTAAMFEALANAPRAPYAQSHMDATRALHRASPTAHRAMILESFGASARSACVDVTIDDPLVVIPGFHRGDSCVTSSSSSWASHPTSRAALAFGARAITLSIKPGTDGAADASTSPAAASTEVLQRMLDRACAASRAASSRGDEAFAALDAMSRLILETRTIVRVDAAWCATPDACIARDIDCVISSASHALDGDAVLCEVHEVVATLNPQSIATFTLCARAFQMPSDRDDDENARDDAPHRASRMRFIAHKCRVAFDIDDELSVSYGASDVDVDVATTSSDDFAMRASIGDVFGEQQHGTARHRARQALMTTSSSSNSENFMMMRFDSRGAGLIDVGSMDARITRDMFRAASIIARASAVSDDGARKLYGKISSQPSTTGDRRQRVIDDDWATFETHLRRVEPEYSFDEDHVHGSIAPMTLALFDHGDDDTGSSGVITIATSAIEFSGSSSLGARATSLGATMRLDAYTMFELGALDASYAFSAGGDESSITFTHTIGRMRAETLKELMALSKSYVEPLLAGAPPTKSISNSTSSSTSSLPSVALRFVAPSVSYEDVNLAFDDIEVAVVDAGQTKRARVVGARCVIGCEDVLTIRAISTTITTSMRSSAINSANIDIDTVDIIATAAAATRMLDISRAATDIVAASTSDDTKVDNRRSTMNDGLLSHSIPSLSATLNVCTFAIRDGVDELVARVRDVEMSTSNEDKDGESEFYVEFGMNSLDVCASSPLSSSSSTLVTLINVSGGDEGASTSVSATYVPHAGERGTAHADVYVADAHFELNAPCALAGARAMQKVLDVVSAGTPMDAKTADAASSSSSTASMPTLTASYHTGVWRAHLPWRSELEAQAPMRAVRVQFQHSMSVRDFVLGGRCVAAFSLESFALETGYYRDADAEDADGNFVAFPVAEIVGASSTIDVPSEAQSYMFRRQVPRVVVAVGEIRARANEVSMHLLNEIADLIIAQPLTADAIHTYEQMPSSSMSFDSFDVSATVDVLSARLEHVRVDVAVPVTQALMSNVTVEVKHANSDGDNSSADVVASASIEIDYLHPVKSAWEPIVEPARISIKAATAKSSLVALHVLIASGVDVTISPSVYEALLKSSLVCEAAKSPIADLGASTAFGPRTYQMTNATGFDVEYALSLVGDHNVTTRVGQGRTSSGETQVMRFATLTDEASDGDERGHRVIERGASYWASPIEVDKDTERAGDTSTGDDVPHVALAFAGIDAQCVPISLATADEEKTLLEFPARLVNGVPTKIIAEVSPCVDKPNRSEVLLRSDVCIVNGTAHTIVLCFQKSVVLPATIFGPIEPGARAWLPIPLCMARTTQWRAVSPGEKFDEITCGDGDYDDKCDDDTDDEGMFNVAHVHGSPFLSPLHRSRRRNATPTPFGRASTATEPTYNWSVPMMLQDFLNNDSAIESSLCAQSAASANSSAVPRPITCALSIKRDEVSMTRQLSLCAPLTFINTLPTHCVVTCRAYNSVVHAAHAREESVVVLAGQTVHFRDTHPTWAISVSARVVGYEACEDLIVPEYTPDLFSAKRLDSGEIYHVNRDAKPVSDVHGEHVQSVSLRFTFYIDEHTRARTLYCAAPLVVMNSTDSVLVLEDMLFGYEMGETSTMMTTLGDGDIVDKNVDVYQSGSTTLPPPSPLPGRLVFDDDSITEFETPTAMSPFARLAQNQAISDRAGGGRSPLPYAGASPLPRQASMQLPAGPSTVTWVTPTRSTPLSSSTQFATAEARAARTETQSIKSATILGSSAHWRKSVARRPRVRIRIKSSDVWSAPFRIDISGAPVDVRVPTTRADANASVFEHYFVIQSELASSDRLCNTVKLTIRSKFVVRSELNEPIWIRHCGRESVDLIPAKSTIPLRWFHVGAARRPKRVTFRPERGVYEWSKPIEVPECAAAIIKMRHIGEDAELHAQTMAVSVRDNDDGTVDIRVARPTEDDGILGMHSIENHSSAMIWFRQVGSANRKTILAPLESAEHLIEEPDLARALVIGYGDVELGEPVPLDVSGTLSYTVVTPVKDCLRITVKHEGPICAIVVEDALNTPSKIDERPRLAPSADADASQAVTMTVKCGWVGVSVLHGHEELMYARVSGIAVKLLADGTEFKSAVRVRSVRVDHTSSKAKRPIVLAVPERERSAREALELHIHGWPQRVNGLPVVRSLKMDVAPVFMDLHEELLDAVPLAIAPCVRHSELLLPPARAAADKPRKVKRTTGNKRTFDDDVSSLTSIYLQEITINDIEIVVSFTSLPFLPVVVRGFAGVDRAHLKLRGFHLTHPSLLAADVGMLAAKHFVREGVAAAGSLWAHNSLLGDPKRLWAEVVDALNEARRGSYVTTMPRVILALTAAFAHAGETALSQARDIVEGWLDALEEAHASRRVKLRPRRLGLADVPANEGADAAWYVVRVMESLSRAVIDVIDSPLSCMELRGLTGLVEGSVLGVLSAMTRLLAAVLDGAEVGARRLRVFAANKPVYGSYMRPHRPLPTSYMEPVRPYHIVEALGREVLGKLARHQRERFVAAASLTWPSHDVCILTGGHLLIAHRGISGMQIPYARACVKFSDIVGVIRDGTRVSVYAKRAPEPERVARKTPNTFMRAYSFAASMFATTSLGAEFASASSASSAAAHEKVETQPKSVVVRCADADAARWLASTLSPFVNANGKSASQNA